MTAERTYSILDCVLKREVKLVRGDDFCRVGEGRGRQLAVSARTVLVHSARPEVVRELVYVGLPLRGRVAVGDDGEREVGP